MTFFWRCNHTYCIIMLDLLKMNFPNKFTSLNMILFPIKQLYSSLLRNVRWLLQNCSNYSASYNLKIFNIQSIYQRRRSRSEMDFVVDIIPWKPLNIFCWIFIWLFATICSWSYPTAILIRQILQELCDFINLMHTTTKEHFVDATPRKPLNRFC